MSINILLSLNIYHMSFTSSFWLLMPRFQMACVFNKTILRGAAFLIIWIGSSKQIPLLLQREQRGEGCVKFGQWAQGKPCTRNLGYHAPRVFATQNITQLPTSTELLPTFTKTTLKIHRIMNGLKECIWKQREPNYTPSCNRVPRSYTK